MTFVQRQSLLILSLIGMAIFTLALLLSLHNPNASILGYIVYITIVMVILTPIWIWVAIPIVYMSFSWAEQELEKQKIEGIKLCSGRHSPTIWVQIYPGYRNPMQKGEVRNFCPICKELI